MIAKLDVGNLPKSITQQELKTLFKHADRRNSESNGFDFKTLSSQNDAENAIYVFNSSAWNEQKIQGNMAKPSFQL